MKRALIVVALFGGLLAPAAAQPAGAGEKEKRTISTTGTATVRVKPDHARVFFGIQTIAPGIRAAREENAGRVRKVMEALKGLAIPDMKMKSSDVTVEIVQTHVRDDRLPNIVGYRVTNTFTVLVKNDDPDKLGAAAARVLDTALENGANIVQHVMFFKQETEAARREALTKAVAEAVANAKALAAGAKVNISETVHISGSPQYVYGPYQMSNRAQVAFTGGEGGTDTALVAGELEITCNVSVTCTY
jgi:hypothetical protein